MTLAGELEEGECPLTGGKEGWTPGKTLAKAERSVSEPAGAVGLGSPCTPQRGHRSSRSSPIHHTALSEVRSRAPRGLPSRIVRARTQCVGDSRRKVSEGDTAGLFISLPQPGSLNNKFQYIMW